MCKANFLTSPLATSLECVMCPNHTACDALNTTLTSLAVEPRYWRPGFNSTVAKQCPFPSTCAGGLSSSALYSADAASGCTPGRGLVGAYCMLCATPKSYFDPQRAACEPCGHATEFTILVIVLGSLIAVAAAVAWHVRPTWWPQARRLMAMARRWHFRARARVLIGFYQIVSQLGDVYKIGYPATFRAILAVLSSVSLQLTGWIPGFKPVCLGFTSYSHEGRTRGLPVSHSSLPLWTSLLPQGHDFDPCW